MRRRTAVISAIREADVIASSLIAYVETRAALSRKHRLGDTSLEQLSRQKEQFERDWDEMRQLPSDDRTVRRAAELAEQHALRGFDALHLASAALLQVELQSEVIFGCFDSALS